MNDIDNIAAILTVIEKYAIANRVPIIQPEAGELLARLVKEQSPRLILEVGTAIGYSTLLMAAQLPPGGHIITIELDDNRAALASHFLNETHLAESVTIVTGDAGHIVGDLTGPFDFVFLDAAKGQYPDYLNKVKNKLADKACIVADNVLFRGFVLQPANTPRRFRTIVKRLQTYLHEVSQDPYFGTTLYKIGDGLAVTHFSKENNL